MAQLRTAALSLLPLLPLAACAEGGKADRTTSEVTVTANHNLYGAGGSQGFTEFPVPASKIGTDRGTFALTASSDYTITRGTVTSSPTEYAISSDGSFTLVVPINNSAPTRFLGAYHQVDAGNKTQAYFFTDRYAPTSAPVVGFFWGTRTVDPASYMLSDLHGDWFVFTQHAIFTTNPTFNPHNVGRSLGGSVLIAAGSPDTISGSGTDSSGAPVALTGQVTFNDKTGNLTLALKFGTDQRVFRASHAKNLILGLDEDESTGRSGLLGMVKQHDITSASDARKSLAGDWHFGFHTIFVAPKNSGVDAANGTLTFDANGGWQLEGVGSRGPTQGKFSYSGTYEFRRIQTTPTEVFDNWLTLRVSGTSETWGAAVDADFCVIVLVDNVVESRTTGSPEINLGMAIRKVVVTK
ncbi:MAG: hypothetical protein KDC87_15405 [Planctomycetes bacterium]|nr:hypothetical protein [Planctomycetota bacterium]